MARRCEAHCSAAGEGPEVGNFGNLGVADFVCGTSIGGDVVDDVMEEVDKRELVPRARRTVGKGINRTSRRIRKVVEEETEDE